MLTGGIAAKAGILLAERFRARSTGLWLARHPHPRCARNCRSQIFYLNFAVCRNPEGHARLPKISRTPLGVSWLLTGELLIRKERAR
jgi:hypothetical protein